jgi:hypothetical protein
VCGGGRGIRTPGTVSGTVAFQDVPFLAAFTRFRYYGRDKARKSGSVPLIRQLLCSVLCSAEGVRQSLCLDPPLP